MTDSQTKTPRSGGTVLALLFVAATLLLLASSTSLWDRDEPRFARAAVEMLATGDYVVPMFNGDLRADKPPMVYWAMSLPLRVLGPIALAVRLPSLVGMLIACGLTGWIGRRMYRVETGRWALVMMGTAILALWIGSASTADGLLIAFLTGALAVGVSRVYDGPKWWHVVALSIALAGGQLTKGPVALAIPFLALLMATIFFRRTLSVKGRDWIVFIVAAIVGFGAFAAWGWPANQATGGELAKIGLGRHVVGRVLEAQEGHGASNIIGYIALLPFYLPVTILGFFPWVLFLPAALSATLRKHLGGPVERALFWSWVVPIFVLMSLVSTKLPHYVLPAYPMLAVISAAVLAARRTDQASELGATGGLSASAHANPLADKPPVAPAMLSRKDRGWLRAGALFYGAIAAGFAIALPVAGIVLGDWAWAIGGFVVMTCIAALVTLVVRAHLRENVLVSARLAAAGMTLVLALVAVAVFPAIEAGLKPAPDLARIVREHADADTPVATSGYNEPSLVFYLNRPADQPIAGNVKLGKWLTEHPRGLVIATQDEVDRLEPPIAQEIDVLGGHEIINYSSRGRRQNVLVVRRDKGRSNHIDAGDTEQGR